MLGQTLTLNGAPYTIIGVLPEAATAFPLNQQQIWVPRPAEVPYLSASQLNNGGYFFQVVARLKPGVSLQQAQEAMNLDAASTWLQSARAKSACAWPSARHPTR